MVKVEKARDGRERGGVRKKGGQGDNITLMQSGRER